VTPAHEFRTLAQTYFQHAVTAPDEVTDTELDQADALVSQLRANGTLTETLLPMLTDDDPVVRFAAASYLTKDEAPQAGDVLREIAEGDYGLVSSGARATLRKRR
jgi:HEAT repeat protein